MLNFGGNKIIIIHLCQEKNTARPRVPLAGVSKAPDSRVAAESSPLLEVWREIKAELVGILVGIREGGGF